MLTGLLLPATGSLSPLQALMWAGLVFPFLFVIAGFIRGLAKSGK